MSLIARSFEEHGMPTLILGSALDILQAGAAPRARFLNYPLGFSCGRFQDPLNQLDVVRNALTAFDAQHEPGLQHLDFSWPEGWQMINTREQTKGRQDTRSPRDTTPRYQTEADRLLAESLSP